MPLNSTTSQSSIVLGGQPTNTRHIIPLQVKSSATQSAHLATFTDTSGNVGMYIDKDGQVTTVSSLGASVQLTGSSIWFTNTFSYNNYFVSATANSSLRHSASISIIGDTDIWSSSTAGFVINPGIGSFRMPTTSVLFKVKGSISQSADLTQWQDSNSTTLSSVSPTGVFSLAGLLMKRQDSTNEGGQISFYRASDDTTAFAIDVYGSGTTPSFRIFDESQGAERIRIDSYGGFKFYNAHAIETATVSATAAATTVTYDVMTNRNILYYTSNASANWTFNVRGNSTTTLNTIMDTGQSLTVVFMNTNGTTAYYPTAFQIDGTAVTPKWFGGSAPTAGNASSVDVYTYNIIKTGSATYTVLASQNKFA